jgi:rSAM/selenodomain-associated transferase 1
MRRGKPEPVAIAILAKAPVAGRVKTRLIPALGAEGAAHLQARLIRRTVEIASEAATGPITLWVSPDGSHQVFADLASAYPIALCAQPDGDLGVRMLAAIANDIATLVIGTDCPALTPTHLRDAAQVLRGGKPVVIPADDGGYVLIGLNGPEPAVFADIAWSTSTVMEETRMRLDRLQSGWRELPPLWDVDRPDDLERLRELHIAELQPL